MLRSILPSDTPILDRWIARDPDHSARGMTAEFFRQPDSLSFAIEDKAGPILYVRIDPLDAVTLRLHIQFSDGEPRRTAVALAREFPSVCKLLQNSGTKYLIFDSVSEPLIRFCQKRFGFVHLPDSNDYLLDLVTLERTPCA